MTVLVLADSHGASRRMLEAAMREREAEACIHLGDGLAEADALATLFSPSSIYRVQGNCDWDASDPVDQLIELHGVTVLLTHGHRHGVKHGLGQLWQTARDNGAQVALFGHTHTPLSELKNGILLGNPGSIGQPRGPAGPTYGLLVLDKGLPPKFEIVRFQG